MSYLLDTNVLSETMRASPAPSVVDWLGENDDDSFISAITIGEIEQGIALLPDSKKKRHLEKMFAGFLDAMEGRILAFDEAVAKRWAALSSASQRKGRSLPILDSMIEATALHWKLTLVTRNVGDFSEAKTLDPWKAV